MISDPGALGDIPYALIGPNGMRYLGLHKSPSECWSIALGWPPKEEIEEYKRLGFAVYEVHVTWTNGDRA